MRKLGFQELPKDTSTKRFGGAIDDYGLQNHMPFRIPKNTVRETECDPQRQLVEHKRVYLTSW